MKTLMKFKFISYRSDTAVSFRPPLLHRLEKEREARVTPRSTFATMYFLFLFGIAPTSG